MPKCKYKEKREEECSKHQAVGSVMSASTENAVEEPADSVSSLRFSWGKGFCLFNKPS